MNNKQKLELTWIGKDKQPNLEPRILIEDPDKSYGDKNTENMLIYGDNLLALKALEQNFMGKIKCIYIDPPFNTGARIDADGKEIGYDDGLEHSEWLNMMKPRLEILKSLLAPSGSIFIHIDDTEFGYLLILCDEVFERENRVSIITNKRGSVTGHKAINPGMVNVSDFILLYAKDKKQWNYNRVFKKRGRNQRYNNFVLNKNHPIKDWEIISLLDAFAINKKIPKNMLKKTLGDRYEQELDKFALKCADQVIQLAYPDYNGVSKEAQKLIDLSKNNSKKIYHLEREDYTDMYFIRGQRLLFYSERLFEIDGELVPGEPISNLWDDVLPNDLHNEGQVTFKKGKKPEKMIKRILELASNPGDFVLDSFGGSGTTAAVAHKMNRKWIVVELSKQCDTHIRPRLVRVLNGVDNSGATKDLNWKGGGGFKYYYLAPSLLKQDKFGNWIIDERYNPDMLAAAMAKHNNFKYQPDETTYWKQGQSTEKDFIFTTTQFISVEKLDQIHEEMLSGESLLICCKSFSKACGERYNNITIKKIPQMLLGKCEFGKEDYSLNIITMPSENDEEFIPVGPQETEAQKKRNKSQTDLFNTQNGKEDE